MKQTMASARRVSRPFRGNINIQCCRTIVTIGNYLIYEFRLLILLILRNNTCNFWKQFLGVLRIKYPHPCSDDTAAIPTEVADELKRKTQQEEVFIRADGAHVQRGKTDNLDRLQTDVSEVTSLLRDNVEKVIVRGDKIDDLQERSEDLEAGSINFKKSSVRLKKKMCWQNCKMNCIIAIVAIVIVAIIVIIIVVEVKPGSSGGSSGNKNKTLHLTNGYGWE